MFKFSYFFKIILVFICICSFFSFSYADDIMPEEDDFDISSYLNSDIEASSNSSEFPTINSRAYVVIDRKSSTVLVGKNEYAKKKMASTTKIMTSLIIIENCNLSDTVTISKKASNTGGSRLGLKTGDKITVHDLLYGLMLRSGNDAAVVIAKNIAGSMEAFAMLMNETASKIGMNDSYFYNAHGLEEDDGTGNLSTAYDMALLTKYAMENETFREVFGTKEYSVKTNKKSYRWTNKNKLLHEYDFITGGKTGFTKKARRTLVTTASSNNIDLVIVTLNDPNDFDDHLTLYTEIFKKYEAIKVLDKKKFEIKDDTEYEDDTLYINEDVYIPVLNEEKNSISVKYELYKNNSYMNGDVVGSAKIYIKEELVKEVNIYVEKHGEKENLSWWDKLLRWLGW